MQNAVSSFRKSWLQSPLVILVLTYDLSLKVISEFKGKDLWKYGQNLKWLVGQPAAFDRTPTSFIKITKLFTNYSIYKNRVDNVNITGISDLINKYHEK